MQYCSQAKSVLITLLLQHTLQLSPAARKSNLPGLCQAITHTPSKLFFSSILCCSHTSKPCFLIEFLFVAKVPIIFRKLQANIDINQI
jgi:hypothetical protein